MQPGTGGQGRTRDHLRRAVQQIQIALFLLAISLPGVGMIVAPTAPPRGETSATGMATRPAPVSALTAAVRWFESRFAFRSTLIRWHGLLMVQHLGASSSDMTLIGRDGWLFLARETRVAGPLTALIYSRNGAPFAENELARCGDAMEAWRKRLEARGCRYLFVVAPNKDTIYPEKMPLGFTRLRPDSRMDQLLNYLQTHTGVTTLDLRPALLRAKQQGTLYLRTDTHWNSMGAFVAQEEIAMSLQPWFPALRPRTLEQYILTPGRRPGGDLARTLGLQDVLYDNVLRFAPRNPNEVRELTAAPLFEGNAAALEPQLVTLAPGATMGRAVIQRDSFGVPLAQFLAPQFRRSVFIWNSPQKGLDWDVIDREKPKVVIHEVVERALMDTGTLQIPPPPEKTPIGKPTAAQ